MALCPAVAQCERCVFTDRKLGSPANNCVESMSTSLYALSSKATLKDASQMRRCSRGLICRSTALPVYRLRIDVLFYYKSSTRGGRTSRLPLCAAYDCLQLGASLSTDGAAVVVQGPEYQAAFFNVLPRSLKHAMKHFDEAARGKVNRLVAVWDERKARTPHPSDSTPVLRSPVAWTSPPDTAASAFFKIFSLTC